MQLISSKYLSGEHREQLARLQADAIRDTFLGKFIGLPVERTTFVLEEHGVVGFFTPQRIRVKGRDVWRTGATFIDPLHRSKSIATQGLQAFYTNRSGAAWIDHRNHRSQRLFTTLGFTPDPSTTDANGCWYYRFI